MTDEEIIRPRVDEVKRLYKHGDRIECIHMEDKAAVPTGTKGTVDFVDAIGQIHVKWDNGRALALIPELDKFKKI